MKHYIDADNQIYGFDDDQADLVQPGMVLIPDMYTLDQYPFISLVKGKIVCDTTSYATDKNNKIIALYEAAAQDFLNVTAISWGYQSLMMAASYATSTNAQYRADAEALIAWRDSVWAAAYTIEQGGLPGSAAEFVAMLPAAPSKPTV